MRQLLLIALLPLAGCANPPPDPNGWDPHSAYRQPMPYIQPAPPMQFIPMQIPQYQNAAPPPLPMRCSTRRVGNTAYTDCY